MVRLRTAASKMKSWKKEDSFPTAGSYQIIIIRLSHFVNLIVIINNISVLITVLKSSRCYVVGLSGYLFLTPR